MSEAYCRLEERISDAIQSIHAGYHTNCSTAAAEFDVPARTLQRRYNGGASKSTRPAANKALSEAQEQAIYSYIKRLDD